MIGLTFLLVTALYGVLLCGTLLYSARRKRSWTHPVILITVWELLFIFLDGIYISLSGSYGPSVLDRYPADSATASAAIAMWMVLHLVMLACFEGLEASSLRRLSALRGRTVRASRLDNVAANYVLVLAFLISLGTVTSIIAFNTSIGSIYELWKNRNLVFSDGGGALLIGNQVFRYGLILWLALRWRDTKRTPGAMVISLVLVAVLFELTTNSRSGMVFGLVLPLVIAYELYRKKIPIRQIVILSMVIFLLFGVAYRTVARDQFFSANRGLPITEVLVGNVANLPGFFWGGFEAASLDGTIDVMRKYENERLKGETVLAAMVAPVPRPLWEDKPRGGANARYTQKFYPEFYGPSRIEYSASFSGELYMNFGIFGSALGGVGLGLWVYILARFLEYKTPVATVIYGIAIGRTFSLLRGDTFNFVAQLSLSLLAFLVFVVLLWALKSFLSTVAYRRYPRWRDGQLGRRGHRTLGAARLRTKRGLGERGLIR